VSESAPAPAVNDVAAAKTTHPLRTAHVNRETFANPPTADVPAANDTTQPAPALNAAPDQTAPAQSVPAQNPLAPTVPQPTQTPDQNKPQNTDQQSTPGQEPQQPQ
jgi:hypothetical protein